MQGSKERGRKKGRKLGDYYIDHDGEMLAEDVAACHGWNAERSNGAVS